MTEETTGAWGIPARIETPDAPHAPFDGRDLGLLPLATSDGHAVNGPGTGTPISAPSMVTVQVEVGERGDWSDTHLGVASARRVLPGGERLDMSRFGELATITAPFRITQRDVVRSYLAPVAAIWARWMGREALRCSSVVLGGRVWGILGEDLLPGGSTLAASLATGGLPVMAADLLVVDLAGAMPVAFAGPRAIDVRADRSTLLERRAPQEAAREASRRRRTNPWTLWLGEAPRQLPLGGFFVLGDEDLETAGAVSTPTRLLTIGEQRLLVLDPEDEQWLALTQLPTFWVPRGTVDEMIQSMQANAVPADADLPLDDGARVRQINNWTGQVR